MTQSNVKTPKLFSLRYKRIFLSMMEEARSSYAGAEEAAIRSRDNRRQNAAGCLGQNQNGFVACKTCDIRGIFLNTTSITRPVDSIPGGTMTMNFFDQFNNRPNNQFRRILKVSFFFNAQVSNFFNVFQTSQCPTSGNPLFRPVNSVFAIWLELTGFYSSPNECNFWIGGCQPACVDKSYSMKLCENLLAPTENHCAQFDGIQGGRGFTFSPDCQLLTFDVPVDDSFSSSSSSSSFSSSSSSSSALEMENPVYKRQAKAITPP